MVLNENKLPIESSIAAEKAICKMHNMPWLRHQTVMNRHEQTEEEMSSGTSGREKPARKNKSKKGRKGQKNGGNEKPANAFLVSIGQSAPQQSAWAARGNVTETLFPEAEAARLQEENELKEINMALEESLKIYREKSNIDSTPVDRDAKEATETSDEDDYWTGKSKKNLPIPESPEVEKISDTNNNNNNNNNSSLEKSGIEAKTPACPGRLITARQSVAEEMVKKFENSNPPEGLLIPPKKPLFIDTFGRINGQNEGHMFMGKGARMREKKYLEQQNYIIPQAVNETPRSNQGEHDTERPKNKILPRDASINQQGRFSNYSTPIIDKYHYIKGVSERRASGTDQKRVIPDKSLPPRQEDVAKTAREFVSTRKESSPRPRDISSEESRIEEVGAIKDSSLSGPRESHEDLARKPDEVCSKPLHLSDFKSRYNSPSIDKNAHTEPPLKPEVTENSSNPFNPRPSQFTEGTSDFQQKTEIPHQSTSTSYAGPPGFQYTQNPPPTTSICDAAGYTLNPENVYDRLAIFDPSLYRLIVQNCIREQSFPPGMRIHRDNLPIYENYPRANGHGDMTKAFLPSEIQVPTYQHEFTENYSLNVVPCPQMIGNQYASSVRQENPNILHDTSSYRYSGNLPPDIRENYQMAYVLGNSDSAGNVIGQSYVTSTSNFMNPYSNDHNLMNLQPLLPNYQVYHDDNLVPLATPSLQLRGSPNAGNCGNQSRLNVNPHSGPPPSMRAQYADPEVGDFKNHGNFNTFPGKQEIGRNYPAGNNVVEKKLSSGTRPSRIPQHHRTSSNIGRGRDRSNN